jgi:group I intron endonuclease
MVNFSIIDNKVFSGFYKDRWYKIDTFLSFDINELKEGPIVYAIICEDKKLGDEQFIYIGSSENGHERKPRHFNPLRNGNHGNIKLQRSYNKRGQNVFKMVVLEYVLKSNQFEREQNWLDFFRNYFGDNSVYNINDIAGAPPKLCGEMNGFFGKKHSEETRKKVADSNRKRKREVIPKKLSPKPEKIYKIINSDGEVEIFKNITHFALSKNINHSKLRMVLRWKSNHHKGYRKFSEEGVGISTEEFLKNCYISSTLPKQKRNGFSVENLSKLKLMSEKIVKTYSFISPSGQIMDITNISKFSKENGLDCSSLIKVAKGKMKSYKGWMKSA